MLLKNSVERLQQTLDDRVPETLFPTRTSP
jgi:hypothetical protein